MHVNRLRLGLAVLASVMVVACATRLPFEFEQSDAPINRTLYVDAAETGAQIYELVPSESLVLIKVGRAGSMSRLGHDHAVASTDLEGLIAIHTGPVASFADVAMPLKNLIVDNLTHRQQLKLESEPSEKDIAGTYSNMQRVLEADTWPWVAVHIKLAKIESDTPLAKVSISLHGVTREFEVPLHIERANERLSVSGQLSVKQSDFGLMPFSALGGLLRVADELSVQFDLAAERRIP